LTALRTHESGPRWQPGAGGLCLHTIILDPVNPDRIFVAISAAGAFRTDDGGRTWQPIHKGLRSGGIPDEDAEVGHCVHRLAMHPSRPGVLYMQKHWDVMRSDNGGDEWEPLTNGLPQENCYVNILRDAMAVDTLDDCGIYFGTTGGQVYGSPD